MSRLAIALAVLVVGCRSSGISTDPPVALADGLEWVEVPPSKDFSHVSPVVSDIERRLPAKHEYWHEDPVTWVHEGTHYINSQIVRQKGKQGLYLMDGRGVVLDQPKLTLAQIAAYIPTKDRRTIYQTYLVDQRQWWNEEPLYLLNEWVAYGNGIACRRSLSQTGTERIDTVRFALEMEVYVQHMVAMAKEDEDYEGIEELKTFVEWHSRRIRDIAGPEDIEIAKGQLDKK
jgi:hypothetical protein